jgi:hypothetical protein
MALLDGPVRELTITTFRAFGLRLIKQWSRELGFGVRGHAPAPGDSPTTPRCQSRP